MITDDHYLVNLLHW